MGLNEVYPARIVQRDAKKKLNPQSIAVSLGWYDRMSKRFHVYFHVGVSQEAIDTNYLVATERSKRCGLGTGATVDLAVADVENKVYGGL